MRYVPVVDCNNKPLMPTTQWRAAKWIASGKATPFWKKGIFCVRLNIEPKRRQVIAVGVDPGSKKEGFTVKSAAHTYLNVQADAVDWVKGAVKSRREIRRARRGRKTPCRKSRFNNKGGAFLAPSTKARWQWKLRVINYLKKLFPISVAVVEDVKAKSKSQKKWDKLFSPLQTGKNWFYKEIKDLGLELETRRGFETKELRQSLANTQLSTQ